MRDFIGRIELYCLLFADLLEIFGADNCHIGQVAILFEEIQTVTENKLVGDHLTHIVRLKIDLSSGRLIQEGAGLYTSGTLGLQVLDKMGQGVSGVNNILDQQEIALIEILSVKVQKHLDLAGRFCGVAIGGCAQELHLADNINIFCQIGGEHQRALQHANKNEILVCIIAIDLLAETGCDILHFLFGNKNVFNNRIEHGNIILPSIF